MPLRDKKLEVTVIRNRNSNSRLSDKLVLAELSFVQTEPSHIKTI